MVYFQLESHYCCIYAITISVATLNKLVQSETSCNWLVVIYIFCHPIHGCLLDKNNFLLLLQGRLYASLPVSK